MEVAIAACIVHGQRYIRFQIASTAADRKVVGGGPLNDKGPPERAFTRGERRDLNPRPPGPQIGHGSLRIPKCSRGVALCRPPEPPVCQPGVR